MDLPREPGFHPCVTGVRSAEGLLGLVGKVYHYGPKRWWVPGPLALIIPPQRVVLVFETRPVYLRKDYTQDEWEVAADAVGLIAEEHAELLTGRARSAAR